MNHIQAFFNTRIRNLGVLSAIGNFFLAPARFIFSGKTVDVERDRDSNLPKKDGSIAKVSSFFVYQISEFEPKYKKVSKQNTELESTGWGYGMDIILTPLIQLALLVPCAIIGSIFKGLSYFSPSVREAHNTVKNKMTAQNKTVGSAEAPLGSELLEQRLQEYLQAGQKTKALVIHARDKTLTAACLRLIKNINPLKLILVGNWRKEDGLDVRSVITSRQNENKWKSWDVSALEPPRQPVNKYDYSVPKSKVVGSIDVALNAPRSTFFSPKHTVYVVNGQQAGQQLKHKIKID